MDMIQTLIDTYHLQAHPEGGYFKQIYAEFNDDSSSHRPAYTSIYFLLSPDSPSHFHRLTCDEIWYYHSGSPLTIHCLHPDGSYQAVKLGLDTSQEEIPCFRVPAGTIFGSTVDTNYTFVSCACVPGFMYEDFELLTKEALLQEFPAHQAIINQLALDQIPQIED